MKIREIKKLAKQLLAIVLIVSLVAGMQPAVAKAAEGEETLTIINIELATKDDAETYTFYNGFNDNWYMLPGTELIVTYSDESTKRLVVENPLFSSSENSNNISMTGGKWGGEIASTLRLRVVDEESGYASSCYEEVLPFTIDFDSETKRVSAKVEDTLFPLYEAQYKDVSAMEELSLSEKEVVEGTRQLRFFRVEGDVGKTYETYTADSNPEKASIDTILHCYAENGEYVAFDDDSSEDMQASVVYRFTEENQSYVIGLAGYDRRYVLQTDLYTKEYNRLKELQITSAKEVWPQFGCCTADYKLVWEDGTVSAEKSVYATSTYYEKECYVEVSSENSTYGLKGTDRAGNTMFSPFPSGTKVSTVSKGNGTKQQVYTVGTKITLKPKEVKLFYTNLANGKYLVTNSDIKAQVYSLVNEEKGGLSSYDANSLSGEYGILVSNPSDKEVADFNMFNLPDSTQVKNLQEYKAGTKIGLKSNETKLLYTNLVQGNYILQRSTNNVSVRIYTLTEGERQYLNESNACSLSGEYVIVVSNYSNSAEGFRVLNLQDKAQTNTLLEYRPGQEVMLNADEEALYRFTGSSTYSCVHNRGWVAGVNSLGGYISIYSNEEGVQLEGEIFLVFKSYINGAKFVLMDNSNPANNVSGPAAKEEWPLPIDEPQKPTNPTTPTNNNSTTNNKPATTTTNTNTSISGKTSTVSKVTFKATSNSAASLTEVKNATTMKSYKVPKTVTIGGKKVKVTTIASNAFKNCKKLKKVTITSNIKTISANAFKNCKKLSTIVIDNAKSLKIKKNAFKGCKKITFKVKKSQMKKFKKMLKKAKIGCKYKVIKK